MQTIKLDSENSTFDAVIKTYISFDFMSKLVIDNGGNLESINADVNYDENISIRYPNSIVRNYQVVTDFVEYKKSSGQTEFDIITNICFSLDKFAKILNSNNTQLGSQNINYLVSKTDIFDFNQYKYVFEKGLRFKNGETDLLEEFGNFLLQENGDYLLQENGSKILL